MANTLDDLYLKYVDKVGKTLENDRYFQYLYSMVEAGNNVLQQKHQILNKVVDERWSATIEDSLDAINNIIEKPRRFITTNEEVVPVSLAKKITADSVRHLSMNTQFIASNEDGDIQPTRILNISTEESYDLYENRFIYHLIHRLIAFVDKRTDVIFWSTGNETKNVLSMESSVDDAYEQIKYKIQMEIKNTQSLVENDNDNMQVFMRIDRVRRLVFALRSTAFYELMNGCSIVRSPIQRTNLMMKDPNYRKCYKLWQFLESYDEVGYTIEEIDSTLEFDQEYMIQMYTNLIANYTVFKSILDSDERNLKELQKKTRKPLKPKFIKQIKEEPVDSPDLPDVEIKKVFVEEVTEAQLEAEAKLEELTKKYEETVRNLEETEESEAEAQRQIQSLYQQISTIMADQTDLEDELQKITDERDAQKLELQGQIDSQKSAYEAQIESQRHEYEARIESQRHEYEAQIESQKSEYETQLDSQKSDYDNKLAAMKDKYESQITDLTNDYENRIVAEINEHEKLLEANNKSHAEAIDELNRQNDVVKLTMKDDFHNRMETQNSDYQKQITIIKSDYENRIKLLNSEHTEQMANIKKHHTEQVDKLNADFKKQYDHLEKKCEVDKKDTVDKLTNKFSEKIERIQKEKSAAEDASLEAQQRAIKALRAKEKAEEKAEGTRLSRYIIASISGKNKKTDNDDNDDE